MTDKDTKGKRETNYKRHGSRYRARRRAVDLLFEAEQRGVDINRLVDERLDMARDPESGVNPVPEYAETIARGVAAELVTIDETIASYLTDEWPLRRIPAVDRAILRVSTWELFFNSEVPPRVAVVEGVELASEYSTDVAPPYINAVLDAEADIADQARLAAAAVSSIVVEAPTEETPANSAEPVIQDGEATPEHAVAEVSEQEKND